MHERMTLTDIARHMEVSRPTAYKIVRSRGFPPPGIDKRWERPSVLAWLKENTLGGAVVVAGVIVKPVQAPAAGNADAKVMG